MLLWSSRLQPELNGILLVDKPAGISSFGVVAKVRWILSQATGKKVKIGHAGTLDPFATGLLILLIGKATKQADQFLKLDKTYEATLTLGATSTTADPEGEITKVSDQVPTLDEIEEVLKKFVGAIQQTPPIFSAIKVNGQRAYKLARKGQEVVMQPREVTIYDISNVVYAYPCLSFSIKVSSGTYIRSLAVDIGENLGVGAYLTILRRTSIDEHDIKDAVVTDNLDETDIIKKLLPANK
jgi:tRNA pseudouridine55 synthase